MFNQRDDCNEQTITLRQQTYQFQDYPVWVYNRAVYSWAMRRFPLKTVSVITFHPASHPFYPPKDQNVKVR